MTRQESSKKLTHCDFSELNMTSSSVFVVQPTAQKQKILRFNTPVKLEYENFIHAYFYLKMTKSGDQLSNLLPPDVLMID